MTHRPWAFTDRLVAKMADSSTQGTVVHNTERTGGVHASTLLREMHKRKKGSDITEEQLGIYGLMGLAFEDRAELALHALSLEEDWPWRCFRPGEVEEDGIKCSPDILLVPKGSGPLRELSLKVKWMSCRNAPREEGENLFDLKKWGYILDQCMTYGTPLDTMGAVVLVYFPCGDYTNFQPQVLGWELEWSLQERAETWDEVVATAHKLQSLS